MPHLSLWQGMAEYAILPYEKAKKFIKDSTYARFQTVLLALFPYYSGEGEGNISLYARGEDYHQVVKARLTALGEAHGEMWGKTMAFADNSPVQEKPLAAFGGLGEQGENTLLLHPTYGSFCFLGGLFIEKPLQERILPPKNVCTHCGACTAACPTGALSAEGLNPARCLSALSQKKKLTEEEATILGQSALIWGCDICQRVCPCNLGISQTEEAAFSEKLLCHLELADLAGLSTEDFKKKYGHRAFSWRGPEVLRRNLQILERGET